MTMLTNIPNTTAAVPIGRKFAATLGHYINTLLAAWIARQQRLAARKMLFGFSDRQLRDIGISRSQIDFVLQDPRKHD